MILGKRGRTVWDSTDVVIDQFLTYLPQTFCRFHILRLARGIFFGTVTNRNKNSVIMQSTFHQHCNSPEVTTALIYQRLFGRTIDGRLSTHFCCFEKVASKEMKHVVYDTIR